MGYVKFENVYKKYKKSDDYTVKDFNLDVKKNEFIVFVGPSGCGKSTTLRMLAGLEDITKGTITIDGEVVNDVLPKDRNISMVFQNYALYPHMTVEENISFGLKIRKESKEEVQKKVKWAAGILGLEDYLKRKPKDLSGGQRQRVALGRAIVRNPKVFLMDEPLSNLDAKLRISTRNEITKIHKSLSATTIYVTHDQVEAMTMADRIVVLKDGVIQQIGTPIELYNKPKNYFVGSFIGTPSMNFINVQRKGNKLYLENEEIVLDLPLGVSKKINSENTEEESLILGIRPDDIKTSKIELDNPENTIIKKEITNLEKMGNQDHVFITLGDNEFVLNVPAKEELKIGDEVEFIIKLSNAHFFDINTKENKLN